MEAIAPFYAVQVFRDAAALEARGRHVIKLSVGEPDFDTPEHVVRAATAALERGQTHYTVALGLDPLRAAIGAHYGRQYGADVAPERIAVTVGASGALMIAFGLFVNPGDEVLLADPTYPSNRAFVSLFGGTARLIPTGPAERFQLTPGLVERHWGPRTRGVLVASPANPTGTTIGDEALAGIHEVVRGRGGVLVVDEIYHGLTYESRPRTATALGGGAAGDVLVVNSFSKYFCMTGWRIGWLVAPPAWMGAAERLAQHLFLAAPTPAQYAALAALEPESLAIYDTRRDELRQRRDFLVPALRGLGFDVPVVPDGAFYVYAGCERFGVESDRLAHELLHTAGVAVTPGRDFGLHGARTHVRVAYTSPMPALAEAVERIRAVVARAGG
jgi:aspartate/methionine/tyrosine aminotransferase